MIRLVLALLVLPFPLSAQEVIFDRDANFTALTATGSTIFAATIQIWDAQRGVEVEPAALWSIDRATGEVTKIAESVYCYAPVTADTVVFGSGSQLWYGGADVPSRFLYESPLTEQWPCPFLALTTHDGAAYWLEEVAREPEPAHVVRRVDLDTGLVELLPQRIEGRLRGFHVGASGVWLMTQTELRRISLDGSTVETVLEETDLEALHAAGEAIYAVSPSGLWRIALPGGDAELLLAGPRIHFLAASAGCVWVAAVSPDDRQEIAVLRLERSGGEPVVVAAWRTRAIIESVTGIRVRALGRIFVATRETVPRSLFPYGAVYEVSPGRARMVIDDPWVSLIAANENEILAAVSEPPMTGPSRIIRVPVRARKRLVAR